MLYLYIFLGLLCLYIIFVIFKSYKQNEYKMFWYNFFKYILKYIFKFYYPYKVINKIKVPDGPVIVVGNHLHLMDQCLPILEINRPIHYMAKIEYFRNFKTKWFFEMTGCIPVNREVHDDNAKSEALKVLNKRLALGLFPEGTRNKTKESLLPFKYGAVSMARKTNATIVPFAITGTYKFRTRDLKINFGKPYKIESDNIEAENEKLYNIILELIKKSN